MTLREIAATVGGELDGNGDLEIHAVSGIREAGPGELTFFANARYSEFLVQTAASAILIARNGVQPPAGISVIYCENPYAAFLQIARLFVPEERFPEGIDPSAVVGKGFRGGSSVSIGACVVIEDDVTFGDGVIVRPGTFIGSGTRIGDGSFLYPNVTVRERVTLGKRVLVHSGAVIGSDGFGFVREGSRQVKVPQIGTVEIGDDVEIGANCAIDRGTTGATRIGRGCKLDNLVHIAHNVCVGEDTLIVAQVGISGSTEIGSRVTLAGQVGVAGHIKIGDDSAVGAQSGATKSLPPGSRVSGTPARPHAETLRTQAAMMRLDLLADRVRELEEKLSRVTRDGVEGLERK